MYIPLTKIPEDISQLKEIISKAFDLFCLTTPDVGFNRSSKADINLLNELVMIEGDRPDRQCWVSFGEYSIDITGKEGYNYMASVTTRGSWDFAGIVAYGLCRFSGYIVFNDAGELDGQNEYTTESLHSTLISRI
jgi:hypothetical protein